MNAHIHSNSLRIQDHKKVNGLKNKRTDENGLTDTNRDTFTFLPTLMYQNVHVRSARGHSLSVGLSQTSSHPLPSAHTFRDKVVLFESQIDNQKIGNLFGKV